MVRLLCTLLLLALMARCGQTIEDPADCRCYQDAGGRIVCNSACGVKVKP